MSFLYLKESMQSCDAALLKDVPKFGLAVFLVDRQ
jgi:hypothetical protein